MNQPALQYSHFTAAFIFSLIASVVFGITQRDDPRAMLKYGAQCFGYFMGGLIAGGWIMWLLHR